MTKQEIIKNLAIAFGGLTNRELTRLARRTLQEGADIACEDQNYIFCSDGFA